MSRRSKKTPVIETNSDEVKQGLYWLPQEANWGGFINIRLEDHEKLLFEEWYEANAALTGRMLDDLLGEGVKFGLSYDRENSCYVATLTGALLLKSNERYALTTRAGTVNDVIALSVWKFVVYAGGDVGNWSPKSGKVLNWG